MSGAPTAGETAPGSLRRAARPLLLGYCLVLAFVLLNPSAALPSSSVGQVEALLTALHAPDLLVAEGRVEMLANAAIMVPVSVLGSLVWPRTTWQDWTAYGFVASTGVEVVQGLLLTGRSATYVDVFANTLGAALGGVLVLVAVGLRGRRGGSAQ